MRINYCFDLTIYVSDRYRATEPCHIIINFIIISARENKELSFSRKNVSIGAPIANTWQLHRKKNCHDPSSHIIVSFLKTLTVRMARREIISYRPCLRRYRGQLNRILILCVARSRVLRVRCQELKATFLSLSLSLCLSLSSSSLIVHGFNPETPRACKTTTPCAAWQTYVDVHARWSTHRDRSWWRI